MAGLTYDGIPSTQTDSSNFSGTNFFWSVGSGPNLRVTNLFSVTSLSGTNLNLTGSALDGDGRLRSLSNGGTFGAALEAGSAIASDVSVNVTFATAFTTIPRVVISPAQSGANATDSYVGSTTTTGFIFSGQSGLAHNYVAVGR